MWVTIKVTQHTPHERPCKIGIKPSIGIKPDQNIYPNPFCYHDIQQHRGIISPRFTTMIPWALGSQTSSLDLCLTSPNISYPLDSLAQSYSLLVFISRKPMENISKTFVKLIHFLFKSFLENHFETILKIITKASQNTVPNAAQKAMTENTKLYISFPNSLENHLPKHTQYSFSNHFENYLKITYQKLA